MSSPDPDSALPTEDAVSPDSSAPPNDTGPRLEGSPNIIVIVADDLGYGDTRVYGNPEAVTPAIDALAASGARFTSAYATAPVCAPSRVGLMTGRYQQRFGFEFNTDDDGAPGRVLDASAVTLAQGFRRAGYATGLVGKWHLGEDVGFRPIDRGFDEYFGFLAGGRPYIPDGRRLDRDTMIGSVPFTSGYLTDVFETEAVAFIERHRDEPFFLYLAPTAPHVPLQASAEDLTRIGVSGRPTTAETYRAMVAGLDSLVSEVLAALDARGLTDDTYVFLVSDNGGSTFIVPEGVDNGELAYGKGVLFEGGIRVPFAVSGPGIVRATSDLSVSTLDIGPTALALAGVDVPPGLDGRDLSPVLRGETADVGPRDLFWRLGPARAMRRGAMKLIESEGSTWLFDLAADPGETRDLHASPAHAATLTEMRAALDAWSATLEDPAWRGQTPTPNVLDHLGQEYRVEY